MIRKIKLGLLMVMSSVVFVVLAYLGIRSYILKNNTYSLKYIGKEVVYQYDSIKPRDYEVTSKFSPRSYNLSRLPEGWTYELVYDVYNSDTVKVILNGTIELSTYVDYVSVTNVTWTYGDSFTITERELKHLEANNIRGVLQYTNGVRLNKDNIISVSCLKRKGNKATLELWDGSRTFKWKVKIYN